MADVTRSWARLLRAGAGPLLVLALTSSCASAPGSRAVSAPVPANSSSATATALSIPRAGGSSSTAPASGVAVDGSALLQKALDQLVAGYHFVTTATVNSTVLVTAQGDRVNDGTRLTVTSNGATIDYVVTPNGTWVKQNGTWSELSDPAPVSDPIGSLRAPTSVTVSASANGAPGELTASYPAAALSVPGNASIDVVFTLDGATLRSLRYSSTANGSPAMVKSDITAVVDTSPVTLPSP